MNCQAGIFTQASQHSYFLEYVVTDRNPAAITTLKIALLSITQNNDSCNLVMAFGKRLWQTLDTHADELGLQDFQTLSGPFGHTAPATQHDLLIWLHHSSHDAVFDTMLMCQQHLEQIAVLALECPGFVYKDNRDLTGFVDGSANPKTLDEQHEVALIGEEKRHKGGSFVLTQKWVHDLSAFQHLSTQQQEQIIGRTKAESIELTGDAMPDNSHVSRTDVSVDGKAQKLYRRSVPFGNANEKGLYFLGFSCQQSRFQIQLERMFGLTEDGIHDRIIDFSKAVNSAYWFAPAADMLARVLRKS